MALSPNYPMCDAEPETALHALRDYYVAKQV